MLFYLVVDEEGRTSISPYPDMARREERTLGRFGEKKVLRPGLPFLYWKSVQKQLPDKGATQALISKALRRSGLAEFDWKWERIFIESDPEAKRLSGIFQQIRESVRGRCLSELDMRTLAGEYAQEMESIRKLLHGMVLENEGQWQAAIDGEQGRWICNRCGGEDCQEWPGVFGKAATCAHCEVLGSLTTLQVLYQDLRPIESRKNSESTVRLEPHWELTEAQKQAAGEVLVFVQSKERKALLWAACGAGKTEVCFPAVAWALEQGQAVLFAAPRQDVIHDVAPRLKKDFPGLRLQVLTGASKIRFRPGEIVLATTHQVLRFFRAFQLIILDEMDAFPYAGNEMLRRGLSQALAPGGKILYLTATPDRKEAEAAKNGKIPLICLPARHHRRELPVPVWERWFSSRMSAHEEGCSPQLQNRLVELSKRGTVLVFVPKISLVEVWVERFRSSFNDWYIDGSSSRDPGRQEKITKLKAGEYHVFVSTSILERGVTVPGVQVIVLEADHEIFDERALVQMAGRAGRTSQNPEGCVIFFAARFNRAIEIAIRQIRELNTLAWSRGLIEGGEGKEC